MLSLKAHSQMAVADGVAQTLLTKMGVEQTIYYAQSIAQMIQSVEHAYQQVKYMYEAEKRALENLRSIADVSNFDDFMKWTNRQLYMEREVEERYNNLGVRIGGKTYRADDIDNIPDALKSSYGEEYWNSDFTEDQRYEMYYNLGLAPGNYMYVKKWQAREDDFVKKMQVQSGFLRDENNQAAERYNRLLRKYATSSDDLDLNEIAKNMGITLMQLEMLLREMAIQMAERNEYDIARDKLQNAPPNPDQLSGTYNVDPFGKITAGTGRYD